uniref:Vacuolar protein sorting-associated protein 54 C-terminal domain-containing protein n=1 Tax=Entomoneis paludosa TaxID=265537 RepID=A0A7S2YIS7_9STRA|mmetsp:Transcript_34877/g.72644  ORF Transcript_34877/g.72644 Transcript_34877/m.72644 type:complete len:483 (+) Transcript_34877:1-1449(+)
MKRLWDKCVSFATQLEELTGYKASVVRSTLLAQAKAFIERKHDSNMSALVAALDSERWSQCDVSIQRQGALTRLCTGRKLITRSADEDDAAAAEEKQQEVEVNGVRYKVVWSCLLLIEMVIGNLSAASHFAGTTSSIVGKVADLLRLFNSRTTQLVLGAKAIHSAARLKSINAKHLSLVTQCLGLVISVLPNIRASLMAHLPSKQHRLLNVMDEIKKEYAEHNEKVLNKFVTIIGGIIEHHLAPKLPGTDFDARARDHPPGEDGNVPCCVFLEGISSNTRKMHHVLFSLLPPVHLQDVFSRIFAFVDTKIPTLFSSLSTEVTPQPGTTPQKQPPRFVYPQTDEGKKRMLLESESMTKKLNGLEGVQPWDFSLVGILERRLEYSLSGKTQLSSKDGTEHDSEAETDVTTVPSDNEDSPDTNQLNGNESSPEPKSQDAPLASEESPPPPPEAEVDEERREDTKSDGEKEEKNESSEYPVEVTTL